MCGGRGGTRKCLTLNIYLYSMVYSRGKKSFHPFLPLSVVFSLLFFVVNVERINRFIAGFKGMLKLKWNKVNFGFKVV